MDSGSLRVLGLLPPLKLVAMILLKVALKHQKSNQSIKSYFMFTESDFLFQKQCKRGQISEFVQIWKAYRFFIFKPMLMIFFL
jgi:hypothetical protein